MPGRCVHHLVEAQASLTPHAVAVAWDGGTLTYRELDERANQLAHALVGSGVRPERLVAVTMEPAPELLVAQLAVWKAGGVYVPIDPSLPRGVAEGMLADAGVALLLRNGPAQVDPADTPVLDLERLDLSEQPKTSPAAAVAPANLAYCVFTSGSTGKPKPVAVAHASLANHARSLRDELGLRQTDRVLQFTAIAFDSALEEVLPAWLAGAAVVMPRQRRFTSRELTDLSDRLGVTMVSLPSAFWHQWVDDLTVGLVRLPASLRIVFVGGDKIFVEKLAAWSRVPGAAAVDWVSDYGPTETSISVALHRPDVALSDPGASDSALVPIGRPFANCSIYLLDGDLRPVPDGAPGDLWVGGPPVARGYYAAPATTADRFLPDPYGPPGSRMYRTGDRGSRRPDGVLTFLGRSDRQVKIRGQRVEPGQVESAVLRCPGVKDAVVIATEAPPFGSRLVAYAEADDGVTEAAIRAEVTGRLPEAMVPHTIMLLDRIPRSPLNGKVARSVLPTVPPRRAERTDGPWRTTLERFIATLFGDLLDGEPSQPDEDFFTAGGDSLRAFQLLSRIAEVTGVALTFAQLRAAPHVAGIAALVKQEHAHGTTDGEVVPTDHHDGPRLASRGQQALWFLDRVHRGAAATYVIPLCFRIRGPLDLDRLDAALTQIVARHEALRTVFEERQGKVWQRVRPATPLHTTVTDVSDPDEAFHRAREAAGRTFDLTTGPLLRSACWRVDAEDHLWLLGVHHAVFDDWSYAVFWRELVALYSGRSLPALTTQFADYSARQERWLRGAEADQQRAYWRAQLAGDLPAMELGPRPATRGRVGAAGFGRQMPPGAVDRSAVERVARECGTTASAVLLAAFFTTLRRTGGVDDAVISVPMACRNRPGTEDMIGYLVNPVALRMRFTEGMSFRELIARTDDVLGEALTNQELPFTDVVESLARRGGAGTAPLFMAMFALQTSPLDGNGTIDGLDITEQFIHSGAVKVALTWTVRQSTAGMAGEVEYAADRFDETSADHWQDTLAMLLAAGLADPDASIDALPVPAADPAAGLMTAEAGPGSP